MPDTSTLHADCFLISEKSKASCAANCQTFYINANFCLSTDFQHRGQACTLEVQRL